MSMLDTHAPPPWSHATRRLSQLADWWLDLVFPPACGGCGQIDWRYCESCLRELAAVRVMPQMLSIPGFDWVASSGHYGAQIRSAIHAFKYADGKELATPLAGRLIAMADFPPGQIDAIAPVPLHQNRLAERGYNQCQLLAEHLAAAIDLPCRSDCITRIRDTGAQALIDSDKRRANVQDAFLASPAVAGLAILLIDDVVTTGATLSECARALRARGANAVYALALCHARD